MRLYAFITGILFAAAALSSIAAGNEMPATSDEILPVEKSDTIMAVASTATVRTASTPVFMQEETNVKPEKPYGKDGKKQAYKGSDKKDSDNKAGKNEEINNLIQKISTVQAKSQGLKAAIIMKTDYGDGKPQTVTGNLIIRKPEKFYIHYTKPSEQFLISNGRTLWVYTPEMNQAIKEKISKSTFNSRFYVEIENSLSQIAKKSKNILSESKRFYTIDMKSREKHPQYDEIICRIDKNTYNPVAVTLKTENVVVEVDFSDIISLTKEEADDSPDMKASRFDFKAPSGVEVIDAGQGTDEPGGETGSSEKNAKEKK